MWARFSPKKERLKASWELFSLKKKFKGGLSIMVWGAIFYDGSQIIVWIDGNIDSIKYCKIIEDNLLEKYDIGEFLLQ
jgi:hypothetical protein